MLNAYEKEQQLNMKDFGNTKNMSAWVQSAFILVTTWNDWPNKLICGLLFQNIINRLVFVKNTPNVYYEVGNEFLNTVELGYNAMKGTERLVSL
jgi:hypothetical protein